MGAETHVASAGTIGSPDQSGQHQGATPAPAKPGGDTKAPEAAKGETPKPVSAAVEKEPEPPKAPTQASDNTASSTGTPPDKSIEAKAEDKASANAKVDDATKAVTEALKATTDGIKAMLDEKFKAVEGGVKEAVKPLEERIKALELQPADKGPIRRAVNAANPVPGDADDVVSLKKMFDDPKTPPAVKSYIGEQLAAMEVSELIRQGPQRIGRKVIAEK